MRTLLAVLVGALVALGTGAVGGVPDVTLWRARDVPWSATRGVSGAEEARLWGDPARGEHGTLNRWQFNTKTPIQTRRSELRIVVLAGTLSIQIENGQSEELGPGSFIRVAGGVRHGISCTAAGECLFTVHQPGPAGPLGGP